MNYEPDIKIVAGLKGGGSLSGSSGKLIQDQLNTIASQINSKGGVKIAVGVDERKISSNQIAGQFNKAIQTAQGNIKQIKAPITFDRADIDAARKQIQDVVNTMSQAKSGFDVSGWNIGFSPDKTSIDATISYYKKGTTEIINDTYQLVRKTDDAQAQLELVWTRTGENVKRETDKIIADTNKAAKSQDLLYQTANKFVSKMSSSAFDPNKNTNILGASNVDEIKSAYEQVIALRDKLNLRSENGQVLNAAQIQEAKVELSDLTIKLTEYVAKAQNAEKYSQSLKPVDITAGVIKSMQAVEKLALDIKSAGVNSEYLQGEIANLYTSLQTVSTSSGLQAVDEQIKILTSDFQIAKKESNIASKTDGLELENQAQLYNQILPLIKQRTLLENQLDSHKPIGDEARSEISRQVELLKVEEQRIRASSGLQLTQEQELSLLEQKATILKKWYVEEANYAAKEKSDSQKQLELDAKANAERDRAIASLNLLQAQFPKMAGTQFQAQFDAISQGLKDSTMSEEEANAQLILLRKNMTAAGLAGQTFGQKVKAAFGKFAQYVSVSTIILSAIRSVKQMVSEVKELDSAMTQLQIVSGKSTSEIRKFGDESIQVAKKIGVAATDVLKAAETYARLGYSLNDALNLSKYTNIFANIADTDVSSATDAITSIMKAYQLGAGDAEKITDILTKVGQEYAVSASELGVALQNGGASLQAANNSLEESVALIAAGNAAVQDAGKVGNALKTTSMRIRGATTAELEDAGADVDGMADSVSKLREELLNLSGVDIQIDSDTFKDTYTIMVELSKVWDKMPDISQANVLELLAGKRNATVIQSIITNIKDLEGAYESASDAAGTTAQANEIFVNSIAGKQKQISASFTEFSDSVMSSDLIKGTYDAGSGILGFLTKLNETIGVLPTTLAIGGLVMLLKNLSSEQNDALHIGLSTYKYAA